MPFIDPSLRTRPRKVCHHYELKPPSPVDSGGKPVPIASSRRDEDIGGIDSPNRWLKRENQIGIDPSLRRVFDDFRPPFATSEVLLVAINLNWILEIDLFTEPCFVKHERVKPQTVIKTNEMFLPGRLSFIFNMEGGYTHDIPTTLHRSRADCPQPEEVATVSFDGAVLEKIAASMSYLRVGSSGKALKKKKKGKDAKVTGKYQLVMDMGGRAKGRLHQWDFKTEEEWATYNEQKEAMPKAAFQFVEFCSKNVYSFFLAV